MNTAKLLLAEDDQTFGTILKSYLELKGFSVEWCTNGKLAYSYIHQRPDIDLAILDVMMPEMDGFTLAKEIKKNNPKQRILFLTARALKEDILKGFELGADDYLLKPFDADVLFYKIQVILNRSQQNLKPEQKHFTFGIFEFNHATRILTSSSGNIQLSPKEADLLKELAANLNNTLSKEELLNSIWGNNDYFSGRSMDVYITKLRKILRTDSNLTLLNIHGKGFMLTNQSIQL